MGSTMGAAQEYGGSCGGWRDLRQTKWRLSKGDEQLDFTFQSAPVAHHISDEAMSELAVCIYKVPASLIPGGQLVHWMSVQHCAVIRNVHALSGVAGWDKANHHYINVNPIKVRIKPTLPLQCTRSNIRIKVDFAFTTHKESMI